MFKPNALLKFCDTRQTSVQFSIHSCLLTNKFILKQCFSTFRKTVRTLSFNENFIRTTNIGSSVRRKFSWAVGFIQWHVVVVSISCPLFVMSQLDVTFMCPNQHYDVVCWHNMHILLQALSLFHVSLHLIETISAPS